jgi:hypothetical protein
MLGRLRRVRVEGVAKGTTKNRQQQINDKSTNPGDSGITSIFDKIMIRNGRIDGCKTVYSTAQYGY